MPEKDSLFARTASVVKADREAALIAAISRDCNPPFAPQLPTTACLASALKRVEATRTLEVKMWKKP